MSTLKRKKGAGGVSETESSEAEVDRLPEPKKVQRPFSVSQIGQTRRSLSAQPSVASNSTSKSRLTTPAVRHLSKASSRPSVPPTPRDTPTIAAGSSSKAKSMPVANGSDDDSSSLPESPVISKRQRVDTCVVGSSEDEHSRPVSVVARSRAQMERELNDLRSRVENLETEFSGRFDQIENRQARAEEQNSLILTKLDTLLSSGCSAAPAPTTVASVSEEKPKIPQVNPPADTAHFEMAQRIQSRRDRNKELEHIPSQFKAQAQSLTRQVAKSMLGVKKFASPLPPFYYKDNQPDFFPAELKKDGFGMPSPHWNLTFAENYYWFSTFILLFKRIIPNDGSPFAAACRELTDYQILILLHDGPFSSLVAAWRKENRSGLVVKEESDEKAKKREVSRVEAKYFLRNSYRSEINAMVGSKWNASWSKGVVSPQVTDDEGGTVVERPEWRAGWYNNLMETISNAERAKELAKPGVQRPLAKRTIKIVDLPPPKIYTGTGKDKQIVKIPLAMISKRWREKNSVWLDNSTHMVDMTMAQRPNVSEFINAHPAPSEPEYGVKEDPYHKEESEDRCKHKDEAGFEGEDEAEDEDEDEDEAKDEGQGEDKGEEGEDVEESREGSQEIELPKPEYGAIDDKGEDESNDSDSDPPSATPLYTETPQEPGNAQTRAREGFAIDPKVLQESSRSQGRIRPKLRVADTAATQLNPSGLAAQPPVPASPLARYNTPNPQYPGLDWAAAQSPYQFPHGWPPGAPWGTYPPPGPQDIPTVAAQDTANAYPLVPSPPLPQTQWSPAVAPIPMPPPPTLSEQQAATLANATVPKSEPHKKRSRPKKAELASGQSTSVATQAFNSPEEPAPTKRGRGRPKGSKNKKTLEKERFTAEVGKGE
ncbi:hypothetical protein BN14_10958 [Rhizoctonia solani AG-1 IB]|uniref:Uncharacterized protein n=2 Tax=Thanatephorus cucumeris (strain AG1-IB / isolate 7/3/14) TaxID=1108050 RepID=M5CGW2_THACB|nr:hypothetical protein BN14_10958 [Rhizoctonia solani AG-1 IB]